MGFRDLGFGGWTQEKGVVFWGLEMYNPQSARIKGKRKKKMKWRLGV